MMTCLPSRGAPGPARGGVVVPGGATPAARRGHPVEDARCGLPRPPEAAHQPPACHPY